MRVAEEVRGVKAGHRCGTRVVLGKIFSLGSFQGSVAWAAVMQCDCGDISSVRLSSLYGGRSVSCFKCSTTRRKRKHGEASVGGETGLYQTWKAMKTRCNNPNAGKYPQYGGRGIRHCDEWREFAVFRNWALTSGYAKGLTIDRIDNDGNYEPANCQWLTKANSAKRKTDREKKLASA